MMMTMMTMSVWMQKVNKCFSNTAVTKCQFLACNSSRSRIRRRLACYGMTWSPSQTLFWISAIAWFETDSEQFPRLKVHIFRRFNCLTLNALGKISTCQIGRQARNSLELIYSTNYLKKVEKADSRTTARHTSCYPITSLSLVGTTKSFLSKEGPCSRLHSDRNHWALFS